jgi:hypothetical protein
MRERRRQCLEVVAGLASRAMAANEIEREALARLARKYWIGALAAR